MPTPRPYSPALQIPMDKKLKNRLKIQALNQGVTLAEFVVSALEAVVSVTELTNKQKK